MGEAEGKTGTRSVIDVNRGGDDGVVIKQLYIN
jgi:hypothetical protein